VGHPHSADSLSTAVCALSSNGAAVSITAPDKTAPTQTAVDRESAVLSPPPHPPIPSPTSSTH